MEKKSLFEGEEVEEIDLAMDSVERAKQNEKPRRKITQPLGRKPKKIDELCTCQITSYLTKDEYEIFQKSIAANGFKSESQALRFLLKQQNYI